MRRIFNLFDCLAVFKFIGKNALQSLKKSITLINKALIMFAYPKTCILRFHFAFDFCDFTIFLIFLLL